MLALSPSLSLSLSLALTRSLSLSPSRSLSLSLSLYIPAVARYTCSQGGGPTHTPAALSTSKLTPPPPTVNSALSTAKHSGHVRCVNGNQLTKKTKYIPKLIRHKLIPLNTELRTTRLVTLSTKLNTTKMRPPEEAAPVPPEEAAPVPKFFGTDGGGGGGGGSRHGAGGAITRGAEAGTGTDTCTGGGSAHGGTGPGTGCGSAHGCGGETGGFGTGGTGKHRYQSEAPPGAQLRFAGNGRVAFAPVLDTSTRVGGTIVNDAGGTIANGGDFGDGDGGTSSTRPEST